MNNLSKEEMIGVQLLSKNWFIIPINFALDINNNFKSVYPIHIKIGKFVIRFKKNTRNNRVLYTQVKNE